MNHSITKIKRGSTTSWNLGAELVNFENYACVKKDSIIHCEYNTITFETGTGSQNVHPLQSSNKIYGQWLIGENEITLDKSKQYQVQAAVEGNDNDAFPRIFISSAPNGTPVLGQCLSNINTRVNTTISNWEACYVFAEWNEYGKAHANNLFPYGEGPQYTFKLSIKEIGECETLEPGQLGLEYTDSGKVRLKAGMPNTSKWNELPYLSGEDDDVTVVALSQYYSATRDFGDGYGTCIVVHDYPDNFTSEMDSSSYTCLVFDLGNDNGRTLKSYLQSKQISKIDGLYISHFHSDHYQPAAITHLQSAGTPEVPDTKIDIKQIILPHGGLTYDFLKEKKEQLTKAENLLRGDKSSVELSSLGVLLGSGYIPIHGIEALYNADKDQTLLGADYYRKLCGITDNAIATQEQITQALTNLKSKNETLASQGIKESEITPELAKTSNAIQEKCRVLLRNYKQGLINDTLTASNIFQVTDNNNNKQQYNDYISVECYNYSAEDLKQPGYLDWFHNQWQNPYMAVNPLSTLSYAQGLDYEYYWGDQTGAIEESKEEWIKAKFHWGDDDLSYWQAWAPKLWGGFEKDTWKTLINTLLYDENNKLRSIEEISKFIKSHLNDKTTSGLYDPDRSEGIVDENDDDDVNESNDNSSLPQKFEDLTRRHFQQLYSSIHGQDNTRLSSLEYNNFSMINVVNVHGKRIIITGDIMRPAIKANLKNICQSDIIIVPHHGLDTGFPPEAMRQLYSQYAVVTSAFDSSHDFARQRIACSFAGELIDHGCTVASTFCGWYPGYHDDDFTGADDDMANYKEATGRYGRILADIENAIGINPATGKSYTRAELNDANTPIGNSDKHVVFRIAAGGDITLQETPSYAGTTRYPITLYPGLNSTMYRDNSGKNRAAPSFDSSTNGPGPGNSGTLADGTAITVYGYGDEHGYFSYGWPKYYSNMPDYAEAENLDSLRPGTYITYNVPHAQQFYKTNTKNRIPFSVSGRKFKIEVEPASATELARTQIAYQLNTSSKVEQLTRTQASDGEKYQPWRPFKQGTRYINKLTNTLPYDKLPQPDNKYVFSNEAELEMALNERLNNTPTGVPYIKDFTFKILDIGELKRDPNNQDDPTSGNSNNWTWPTTMTSTGDDFVILTATCGYAGGTTIQKRATPHYIKVGEQVCETKRAWQPFEFVNPSNVRHVEYRTTERYLTWPVYSMMVDINALDTPELERYGKICYIQIPQYARPIRLEIYSNGILAHPNVQHYYSSLEDNTTQPGYVDSYIPYGKTSEDDAISLEDNNYYKITFDSSPLGGYTTNDPAAPDVYIKLFYVYSNHCHFWVGNTPSSTTNWQLPSEFHGVARNQHTSIFAELKRIQSESKALFPYTISEDQTPIILNDKDSTEINVNLIDVDDVPHILVRRYYYKDTNDNNTVKRSWQVVNLDVVDPKSNASHIIKADDLYELHPLSDWGHR